MTAAFRPTIAFDHAVPLGREELLGWGERLRRDAPIAFSDAHDAWVVSRYRDICAIARDAETFISGKGITIPPFRSPVPVIPAESDAPDHSHYRAAIMAFVQPRQVKAHEAKIRRIILDALEPLVARGEGDAVTDYAALIPTRAMASIFGFRDEDAFRFDADFSELLNAVSSGDAARQARAVTAFKEFLTEKLDERRATPGDDDIVSAILRYDSKGKTFNADECLGLLWSAAAGAVDTTKHAIGHSIYNLAANPGVRERVLADPALLATLADEMLRVDSPAYFGGRHVARDTVVGGVDMKAGEKVLLIWGAGNRDAAEFANPATIDPARKPNRHLAFGHGSHQCAGMHLARAEIRIAIEELLRLAPAYQLPGPTGTPRVRGGLMWAFDTLPIRLR